MADLKKHFAKNWRNYLIVLLVLMVIGGNFFTSFLPLGTTSVAQYGKSMESYDSVGNSVSRGGIYYDSGSFAPDASERKRIKSGSISVESSKYDYDKVNLNNLIVANNGIVLNENEYKYNDDYRSLSLQVKVPADKFDSVVAQIKSYGEVESVNVYVNDVTGSYEDYSDRVKRYEDQIVVYKAMLGKQNLTIKEEIEIQQRIDQLEDSIFYLNKQIGSIDERVEYSDLSISLQEKPSVWSEIDFLGLRDGFKMFMDSLQGGIKTILNLLGFILPFGLVYLIYRLTKKFAKKSRK